MSTLKNIALLLATVGLIFLVDRAVLRVAGGLWVHDAELLYRHRPGVVSQWGVAERKEIRINRHGHHDGDYDVVKPAGQLRGLIIGDSVVMGHGVTAAEAFPNQLEDLLEEEYSNQVSFQMINAGVQGYSTFQYLGVLKRSLEFDPDFLAIGVCMNDMVEPYVVNKDYGGSGLDYHSVIQGTAPVLNYLLNETGIGRLALRIRWKMTGFAALERKEIYSVRNMAEAADSDERFAAAWEATLSDLEAMYDIAEEEDLSVILLVFPFSLQIDNEPAQGPQRRLIEHARFHGVTYLDMTRVVEQRVAEGEGLDELFLDRNHYTVRGHRVVAEHLAERLREDGILPIESAEASPNDKPGGRPGRPPGG